MAFFPIWDKKARVCSKSLDTIVQPIGPHFNGFEGDLKTFLEDGLKEEAGRKYIILYI
ncbi:hypothetical protein [Maribacter arenosus]|uniref:Uncharacterized protein n=1 Tax=Maribacter arenosus TaxID=1854708 RepID=A0ABR7VCE5_9FLAO|nr:hypothetical protein [Maribacter arenosus]MBD0849827.1 hypothetical protein [Maribacter arenosus]